MIYTGAHRTDIPLRTDIGKILPYQHKSNRERLYGQQAGNCGGCETHFPDLRANGGGGPGWG